MKTKSRIRQYLKNYKFNSLFFRNLLLLQLLIIVPLTGVVALGYYAYSNMQKNEIKSYSERITGEYYAQWERILKEASTELNYIGFSTDVELYMYDTEELRQLNYRIQSIQELIKMPVLTRSYVDSVYLHSYRSSKVISLEGMSNYDTFRDKACLEQYENQTEGSVRNLLVYDSAVKNSERKQLSVCQDVRYGSKTNGVIVMNLNLAEVAREMRVPEYIQIYLTDQDTVLFSSDMEAIGKPKQEIDVCAAANREDTVIGREGCICSLKAPNRELELIVLVGMNAYHNQLSTVLTFMTVFILVMILVTLLLAVLISVRIFRPIESIVSSIQEHKNVLIGEGEVFQEKDELEYILRSIDRSALVKKDVDEELSERVRLLKKAQAVALQSQITPHFLNNTLETINWIAIGLLGGRNEISEMTGALSQMLRMALENTDTIIPMSMEIDHCMNYLKIQKKRYEDQFEVEWNIPRELYQCKTIRIILQPIVENAIYHGVKSLSSRGLITITGRLSGSTVELEVKDNGLGMSPEELKKLQETMHSDMIKESRHIGVANVNQRLKLYFGAEYGIYLDSQEGVGTCVTIRFPRITEG